VRALSDALAVQRRSIEKFALEDRRGRLNGPAIGYMYGFVDAGLQAGGIDIRTSDGARAFRTVSNRFARGRASAYVTFLNRSILHDPSVRIGIATGRRELKIWLASGNETVPSSWAELFPSPR
jgi:hypothetical protein